METDVQVEILKYLQENKAANTFKLARNLGIDRSKIVRELNKLAEKGLIEHRTGMARLLSTPKPGLPGSVQKISKPITEKPRIRKIPSANIKLADENKNLKARLEELTSHVEQQDGMERRLKAQNAHVVRLEEGIRTLQQKASIAPKVITKTVVKTIVRRVPKIIVRRIPAKSTQTKKMFTRLSVEAGKPVRSWLSNLRQNIIQLSIPEMLKQQVELKPISFDFRKLNEKVSLLEIPEILKKGW